VKTWFVCGLVLFAWMGLDQRFAAAAPAGTAKPAASQASQKASVPRNPADAQIERAIRTKLAKSKLSADHFTFSVTGGVATLEGSTSVMQHKGAMTRIAKSSGATSVHNNIRISDAAKAKATAALTRGRSASGGVAPATPVSGTSRAIAPANSAPVAAVVPANIPRATVLPPEAQR